MLGFTVLIPLGSTVSTVGKFLSNRRLAFLLSSAAFDRACFLLSFPIPDEKTITFHWTPVTNTSNQENKLFNDFNNKILLQFDLFSDLMCLILCSVLS